MAASDLGGAQQPCGQAAAGTNACDERYRRGVEILQQLSGARIEEPINRVAEVAPDLARMAIEFPFGDLYARKGLDLRTRELIAIACLAVLGHAPQLARRVEAALDLGCSPAEVVETLMQTVIYAGFPAALNALSECRDLLAAGVPACRSAADECSPSCGRQSHEPCDQAAARCAGQG